MNHMKMKSLYTITDSVIKMFTSPIPNQSKKYLKLNEKQTYVIK